MGKGHETMRDRGGRPREGAEVVVGGVAGGASSSFPTAGVGGFFC